MELDPEAAALHADAALKSADALDRHQAASALCRRRDRRGVPELLSGELPMTSLNAIRAPEAWDRLVKGRLAEDWEGTRPQLLERVAREAGLRPELPPVKSLGEDLWTAQWVRIRSRGGSATLLEALDRVMDFRPFDVIVEADRLRILPREEARQTWKTWWEKESSDR
jgi:hypothetical protein